MNALSSCLWGPVPDRNLDRASAIQVIGWWEKRRFGYNLVVGSAGILTFALMLACAFVSETVVGVRIGLSDGPRVGIFAAIAYGVMANICYTSGWIAELVVRSVYGQERADVYGARVFRLGVRLSLVLTFVPAVVCWIALAVAVMTGHKPEPGPE